MDLGRFRLIVFDCDGTLVDSQATILQVMKEVCIERELAPPPDDRIRRTVGLTLEIAMDVLWPEKTSLWHRDMADAYRAKFREHRVSEKAQEHLFDGIQPLLDSMQVPHLFLGVATGKEMHGLEVTLRRHNLFSHFHTFQTADKCHSKPHPDMILKAMAEMGCNASETVMIGDTSFDMQMARAAKVAAIGVSWGYHPKEELDQAGAHGIIHHTGELAELLRKLP